MASIFGPTGQEVFRNIQRQRAQEAAALGARAGTLTPQQMFGQAGSFLGLAAGEALSGGRLPPEVVRANKLQAAQQSVMRSGVDASDPVEFNRALAEALAAQGLLDESRQASTEAERLEKEQVEEANVQSLIEARLTAKQQIRQDELTREARAEEGRLGRESREEIARLDRELRERLARQRAEREAALPAPVRKRAATASDVQQAEPVIRDTIGEEQFDELENAEDMVRWVAQRAKDLATDDPTLTFQEAQELAAEEARRFIEQSSPFGLNIPGAADLRFNPPGGEAQGEPAEADVQSRADAILGL